MTLKTCPWALEEAPSPSSEVKMSYYKRPKPPAKIQSRPEVEAPNQPVIYSAQMQNEQPSTMNWIRWPEGHPDIKLYLSPTHSVTLREGDSVLSTVQPDGTMDIYGYRPRTLN